MGYILKIGDNVPAIGKNILANLNTATINITLFGNVFTAPRGVDILGNVIYVADYANSAVYKYRLSDYSLIATVPSFSNPFGLSIDAINGCYYTTHGTTSVRKMSISTDTQVGSLISGFTLPLGITVDAAGAYYYVSHGSLDNYVISKRRVSDNAEVLVFTGLSQNIGLSLDAAAGFLYAANNQTGNNTIKVFNITSGVLVKTITGFSKPFAVMLDVPNNRYYVSNNSINMITVANYTTDTVISTINLTNVPTFLTKDNYGNIYTSNANKMSAISTIYA